MVFVMHDQIFPLLGFSFKCLVSSEIQRGGSREPNFQKRVRNKSCMSPLPTKSNRNRAYSACRYSGDTRESAKNNASRIGKPCLVRRNALQRAQNSVVVHSGLQGTQGRGHVAFGFRQAVRRISQTGSPIYIPQLLWLQCRLNGQKTPREKSVMISLFLKCARRLSQAARPTMPGVKSIKCP